MLLVGQIHALLMADRSRDVEMIHAAIDKVMAENPDATLLDCEMAFRDAAAHTYLVMDEEGTLHIVFGMQAWKAKLVEIDKDNNTLCASAQSNLNNLCNNIPSTPPEPGAK